MTQEKKKLVNITSGFERFSYGIYFFGQLLFFGIVTGFLSLYLTDSGVPAIMVSGIFAIAKVWDAINDPIFGVIVDKANLRKGKYIPWVRMSSFMIPITTIILFAMPSSLSLQVKIIWAAVAYMLWDTSYTLCDVPIFALATSMTDQVDERDRLYLINRIFTLFGTLAVGIAVPLLYPQIGWTATAIVLGVVGMVTMLPIGYVAKERFFSREENEKSPTLKALVQYLFKNKYLLIFNGAVIVSSITSTSGAVGNYVAIHLLGGSEWITIVSLVAALPMFISILITNILITRIDKRSIFIGSLAISLIIGVATYFVGYDNKTAYLALVVIKGLFGGAMTVTSVMFTADCAEYGHFVTGERAQGVAFSIQTFTAKLTAAISGSIGMLALGLVGFVEGAGATQSAYTLDWIWKLNTLIPCISGFVALFMLIFLYKLRTPDVKLMTKANAGEITREEAIAGFSQDYGL